MKDLLLRVITGNRIMQIINAENIVAFIAVVTTLFAIVAAFITWKIDRTRLSILEKRADKMRKDFDEHKILNEQSFDKIYNRINESNISVESKIDELKWYLIHGKINVKGEIEDEQNRERNRIDKKNRDKS